MARLIGRLSPMGMKLNYPEQESGPMNALLPDIPADWRYNETNILLPAGLWTVHIVGQGGSTYRFYTATSEWVEFIGSLHTIVEIRPGGRQRFWAANYDGEASGTDLKVILSKAPPATP